MPDLVLQHSCRPHASQAQSCCLSAAASHRGNSEMSLAAVSLDLHTARGLHMAVCRWANSTWASLWRAWGVTCSSSTSMRVMRSATSSVCRHVLSLQGPCARSSCCSALGGSWLTTGASELGACFVSQPTQLHSITWHGRRQQAATLSRGSSSGQVLSAGRAGYNAADQAAAGAPPPLTAASLGCPHPQVLFFGMQC